MSLIKEGVLDAETLREHVIERYMILQVDDKKTQIRSRLPR